MLEEVGEGFRPDVEKVLQTTGITIKMRAGDILRLPAFLPFESVNGKTVPVKITFYTPARIIPYPSALSSGLPWDASASTIIPY
ncbi:MAG: hypothetical protein IJ849_10480 [Selenomonadaceae bacterium]|nr:hypothetical protein [Selenomonadaceae bacterium]